MTTTEQQTASPRERTITIYLWNDIFIGGGYNDMQKLGFRYENVKWHDKNLIQIIVGATA